MPELPEVEFARGCLMRWLGGRVLDQVEADRTRIVRGSSIEAVEALAGHRLQAIERRGKWLLGKLDGGRGLLAHLGMTGKFVLQKPDGPGPTASRVRFIRGDGAVIHYRDSRMFGQMIGGVLKDLALYPTWHDLGPDAWDDPPSPTRLCELLHARKRTVKDVLMDQTVIAGLGNIQATEALFQSGIHPARPASSIKPEECARLSKGIHWTLDRSIKLNDGDSITYVEEGGIENPFVVYGRTGEPCPRCGTKLQSSQIGGRTSAFCPKCQPRRPPAKARGAARAR